MRAGLRAIGMFAATLVLAASAFADVADDARTGTLSKARQALEELGAWCGEQQLLKKRAAIGEALLAVDPDHENARAWLLFKKDKHGDWVRPPGVVPPVDGRADDWPDWIARRTEVLDPLRKNLEQICDFPQFAKTPGRERTLRLLVALYPDDAELRAKHGEKRVGGKWILDETAATSEGRKRVEGWVKEAMKTAGAKPPAVERKVSGDEAHWACSSTLDNVFVATTSNAKDLSNFMTRVVAAERLVDFVMGRPGSPHPALRIDLLDNYWENKTYLEKCKDKELTDEKRKKYLDWSQWWRTPDRLVVWGDGAADRLDGAVRQIIDHQPSRADRSIWGAPAWMSEGIGLYLTWRLLGTRLTYFVVDTKYADEDVKKSMLDPASDWLALARKIAQKQGGTRLPILAGVPLNGLTSEDDVMAFAVAAYLVETRPESVAAVFEAAASWKSVDYALTRSIGLDLESLDARFARWLDETR